ncbi:hypothetical protein ABK040_009025 [Willaertia magna]
MNDDANRDNLSDFLNHLTTTPITTTTPIPNNNNNTTTTINNNNNNNNNDFILSIHAPTNNNLTSSSIGSQQYLSHHDESQQQDDCHMMILPTSLITSSTTSNTNNNPTNTTQQQQHSDNNNNKHTTLLSPTSSSSSCTTSPSEQQQHHTTNMISPTSPTNSINNNTNPTTTTKKEIKKEKELIKQVNKQIIEEDKYNSRKSLDIAIYLENNTRLFKSKRTISIIKSIPKNKKERTWKQTLYLILEHPRSSYTAMIVTIISSLMTIIQTVCLILRSFPFFFQFEIMWLIITCFLSLYFLFEYLLRMIAYVHSFGDFKHFILNPMNIIDVLSFTSFWIDILLLSTDLSEQFYAQTLTVFRVLRLLKLLKLTRFSAKFQLLLVSIKRSFELLISLAILVVMGALISSTLIYYAERGDFDSRLNEWLRSDGQTSPFSNIMVCMWFSIVSLATVGYGDVTPITVPGRMIAILTILSGIMIMALPSMAVGGNYSKLLDEYAREMAKRKASGILDEEEDEFDVIEHNQNDSVVVNGMVVGGMNGMNNSQQQSLEQLQEQLGKEQKQLVTSPLNSGIVVNNSVGINGGIVNNNPVMSGYNISGNEWDSHHYHFDEEKGGGFARCPSTSSLMSTATSTASTSNLLNLHNNDNISVSSITSDNNHPLNNNYNSTMQMPYINSSSSMQMPYNSEPSAIFNPDDFLFDSNPYSNVDSMANGRGYTPPPIMQTMPTMLIDEALLQLLIQRQENLLMACKQQQQDLKLMMEEWNKKNNLTLIQE